MRSLRMLSPFICLTFLLGVASQADAGLIFTFSGTSGSNTFDLGVDGSTEVTTGGLGITNPFVVLTSTTPFKTGSAPSVGSVGDAQISQNGMGTITGVNLPNATTLTVIGSFFFPGGTFTYTGSGTESLTYDDITYDNLIPGTYTLTSANYPNENHTLVVEAASSAVPEPASIALLGMMGLGAAGIGYARKRKKERGNSMATAGREE